MASSRMFSFDFGGKSSKDFGLLATSYDFLFPPKRERKQFVPFRHGMHDYGAKYYNERMLRLHCMWTSSRLEQMTRSEIREIAYWLSQKSRITLDVEPEKHYIGELYEPGELVARYNYAKENITSPLGEFTIEFVCEPFAYREVEVENITSDINTKNKIEYKGTAETPCVIILKNNSNFALNNVKIVVSKRR